MKILKYSSTKYYQNNKGRLKKKTSERYQSLSKGEKEKKQEHSREWYKKIYQKMKHKSLFSTEKVLYIDKKSLIIIIRNYNFKK